MGTSLSSAHKDVENRIHLCSLYVSGSLCRKVVRNKPCPGADGAEVRRALGGEHGKGEIHLGLACGNMTAVEFFRWEQWDSRVTRASMSR